MEGTVTMKNYDRFWDRIAERYARQPVADEAAYEKKLEVTRGYLDSEASILEIGCGTGSTALAHAPYVSHVRATDISAEMIRIAKDKAVAAGVTNVDFEQAAVEDLEIADGGVDAVLALSLLHLLEDREPAIARIHAMLKPGGVFVSNTVCLGDSMKWFKLIGPIGRFFRFMPLVRVFRADELRASLRAAGFEIEYDWQPNARVLFIVARKAAI